MMIYNAAQAKILGILLKLVVHEHAQGSAHVSSDGMILLSRVPALAPLGFGVVVNIHCATAGCVGEESDSLSSGLSGYRIRFTLLERGRSALVLRHVASLQPALIYGCVLVVGGGRKSR